MNKGEQEIKTEGSLLSAWGSLGASHGPAQLEPPSGNKRFHRRHKMEPVRNANRSLGEGNEPVCSTAGLPPFNLASPHLPMLVFVSAPSARGFPATHPTTTVIGIGLSCEHLWSRFRAISGSESPSPRQRKADSESGRGGRMGSGRTAVGYQG